jgi:hypothetical protein
MSLTPKFIDVRRWCDAHRTAHRFSRSLSIRQPGGLSPRTADL